MTDGNDSTILLRSPDGRMPAGCTRDSLDVTLARVIWASGLLAQRRRGHAGLPGGGGAHFG